MTVENSATQRQDILRRFVSFHDETFVTSSRNYTEFSSDSGRHFKSVRYVFYNEVFPTDRNSETRPLVEVKRSEAILYGCPETIRNQYQREFPHLRLSLFRLLPSHSFFTSYLLTFLSTPTALCTILKMEDEGPLFFRSQNEVSFLKISG